MTILIVDDNEQNLYQLQVLLGGNGYQVVCAANGVDALAKARQNPPDLIVSDILMPVMDGFALCREWKKDEHLRLIPFLFYTSTYTDDRDQEFALNLGADQFLIKPVEPEVLMRKIREVLQQARRPPAPSARVPIEAQQQEEAGYLKQYNEALIRKLETKVEQLGQAKRELEGEITERRHAEAELQFRNVLLSTQQEASIDGILVVDENGGILSSNRRFADMWGIPSEIVGSRSDERALQSVMDRLANPEEFISKVKYLYKTRNETSRDEIALKDGRIFDRYSAPMIGPDERYHGRVWYFRDISEGKRAEERLRQQAALLDAANDAIYVHALDHTVTYWNQGAERLFGWSSAEALGRKITELAGRNLTAFEAAQAALLKQGSWSGELNATSKDGQEHVVFCRWTLLRDGQGLPTEILAINTDISEQKQLEAKFLRAQRLESIGALASGIAHDLNNILAPLLMIAPLLREKVQDADSLDLLDTVERCAQRGADIIRQLLTFGQGVQGERVPLQLRHLIKEMGKVIREIFPRDITYHETCAGELWPIVGDATQLHQVLLNLCVNARDAMPLGGRLTIRAANRHFDEQCAALIPEAHPGPHVVLEVQDTGQGIPPEIMDRIFDPFFTTKQPGQGTGLGLATVLGIVRNHGGFIQVDSTPGQGSRFVINLPARPDAFTAAAQAEPPAAPLGQGELVLVVDDEASVRDITQFTLERHGYRVLLAEDGAAALAVYARHSGEVNLVLTDLMMPIMDGVSLTRALRHLNRALPIMASTGNLAIPAQQQRLAQLKDLGVKVFLSKPYSGDQLLQAVNELLHKA